MEAQDWKAAVQMYRQNDRWEEALRVAKVYGSLAASKQVGQLAIWHGGSALLSALLLVLVLGVASYALAI